VFSLSISAAEEDIDELGHVNNAVWVQWIQTVAVAHWDALATAEERERFFWVITRHEIDYLRAAKAGETVTGRTWVPDPPRGARFDRHMEFTGPSGAVLVRAVTTWAMIDRESGRPNRVPAELAERFRGSR
jgi:acyl-CoA thioester hydrolase